MISKKRILVLTVILCVALLATSQLFAQDEDDGFFKDWQMWQTFKVKGKITDKVTGAAEIEMRLTDNIKSYTYLHTQIGLGFKLTDMLSTSFNFRFKQSSDEVGDEHPFKDWDYDQLSGDLAEQWAAIAGSEIWTRSLAPHFNFTVKLKPGGMKTKIRTRLEFSLKKDKNLEETADGWEIVEERSTDYYLRPKVSMTFPVNLGPFKPWVADELFFKLSKDDDENLFYRNRLWFGVGGTVIEHVKLKPYFLLQIQNKKTDGDWSKTGVIGLKTEFSF